MPFKKIKPIFASIKTNNMDKEYLERLKKEDYIAWDSLVNDPQIVGVEDNSVGCLILFLVVIVLIIFRVIYFN